MQSHWSKPARWKYQNQNLRDQLLMYGLSAFSLRKAFDCPVFMVTDSRFASILSDLPKVYDGISTELDDLKVDREFWAFPKFHIDMRYGPEFAAQNTRIVQCDTDVFFWEPMQIGDAPDILVQSIEGESHFRVSYKKPVAFTDAVLKSANVDIPCWNPMLEHALNCGVVAFKDGNYAAEYAQNATKMCEVLSAAHDAFLEMVPQSQRQGSIMVVPEQYYLLCCAVAKENVVSYVSTRLTGRGKFKNYDPDDYYHMMGDKDKPAARENIAVLAEERIPEFYHAVTESAYGGF